jgi:hypothetical protein
VKNQSRCEKFGGAKRDRTADLFNAITSIKTKNPIISIVEIVA